MAWTIRKTEDDIVLYSLPKEPVILEDKVQCVHPLKGTPLEIWDLNQDNCIVEEVQNDTVPEDFIGGKYKLIDGEFVENPDYNDPKSG